MTCQETECLNLNRISIGELGVAEMDEKEKALELIKRIRKASYNHAYYGTDMAIDEETAVEIVEEVFDVEELM